jgi:acyl-coenzyme A thioesterase PaaI-like protein
MSSAPISSTAVSASDPDDRPAPGGGGSAPAVRRTAIQRLEAWMSRLSTKNAFWQRTFALVYLPFAFRSGISVKRTDPNRFVAVLPFTRFNRNWYNAMAGAALLGNSEVAGGMYLFAKCGGDYTVVCKEMSYRFLRPCVGPATYEVVRGEAIDDKLATKGEFNIDLEMEIRQQLKKRGRELLVGRCTITFHCTPKSMVAARRERRAKARAGAENPR